MKQELIFDIVSDEWAGGLYLDTSSKKGMLEYHRTESDLETEKTTNQFTSFVNFSEFWKAFTSDGKWFTYHPLFVHPDHRPFIRSELSKINWQSVRDEKWRDMYQRQWNKVLTGPSSYYRPLK